MRTEVHDKVNRRFCISLVKENTVRGRAKTKNTQKRSVASKSDSNALCARDFTQKNITVVSRLCATTAFENDGVRELIVFED